MDKYIFQDMFNKLSYGEHKIIQEIVNYTDLLSGVSKLISRDYFMSIDEYKNLTYLDCHCLFVDQRCLSNLVNLTYLKCKHCTGVGVMYLSNLKHLDCDYNDFTDEDICHLTNLTHFECGVNYDLTDKSLMKLVNLTYLDCGRDLGKIFLPRAGLVPWHQTLRYAQSEHGVKKFTPCSGMQILLMIV